MPIWVHYLSDPWPFPAADQRRRLGGKGASLRCLREAGLIVPPGFTITTDAVREFLANGHWPVGVEAEVAAAFERLRVDAAAGRSTEFDSARPLTVAVRSGAETSHPGLMRTILHCGWTETLARQVNSAEAWTEFADFLLAIRPDLDPSSRLNSVELCARLLEQFRQRGPIRDEPHFWLWEAIKLVAESSRSLPQSDGDAAPCTAVTVQAMFPAEVSGVLFSRDPLEPQAAHLVIEAVSGGGQRLMSGEVSPWSCRLDRLTLRPLVEAQVSQPSLRPAGLSEQHLEAIARAALRMETEFAGNPVDLEWGCASGRVVYFQVRPLPLASNQESDTKQQFGTVHCSPTLGGSVDSCDLSESSRPQGSGLHLPGNVQAHRANPIAVSSPSSKSKNFGCGHLPMTGVRCGCGINWLNRCRIPLRCRGASGNNSCHPPADWGRCIGNSVSRRDGSPMGRGSCNSSLAEPTQIPIDCHR